MDAKTQDEGALFAELVPFTVPDRFPCDSQRSTITTNNAAIAIDRELPLTWIYPALMSAAIATGIIVSRWTQRPLPLSMGQRFGIGLGAFCGGMLGAKLPFVLLDWEGFLSGAAWFDSGKTLMMGLVGAYAGVEAAKWALHITIKTGDSFAAPAAAAIAVGRLASAPAAVTALRPICRGPSNSAASRVTRPSSMSSSST
jgi:hypothetical protein